MYEPGEGPVRFVDLQADAHGVNSGGGERRAGLAVALAPPADARTGMAERERGELDYPITRPRVGQREAKQPLVERLRRGDSGDREDGKRFAEARPSVCYSPTSLFAAR